MSDYIQIIAASFDTEDGAKNALKAIKKDKVSRGNVAIISKSEKGKLHVKETQDWGAGKGAAAGFAAAWFIPIVGCLVGAAAGAVIAKLRDSGFPNDTLKGMGDKMEPGHSALVMVVDGAAREEAERVLLDGGGHMISQTIEADLAEELDVAAEEDETELVVVEEDDES